MSASRLRLAPRAVLSTPLDDGGVLLRSPQRLGTTTRAVGDWLVAWAARAPERDFLVEKALPGAGSPDRAGWRRVDYRSAHTAARSIGQALLDLGLSASRPLMLLSDNGVDHALLQLGAMHAGIPVAPVSPAYSLVSQDFAKLREIAGRIDPGAIYAADGEQYARAITDLADLDRVQGRTTPLLHSLRPPPGRESTAVEALLSVQPGARLDAAFAALGPDTIAKVLFTSGSTGWPRGVVNTHRMLCSNQQAIAQLWPFLDDRPPVIVDWLPWSHTFGGNHNFNMALRSGGTLYVDRGKPAAGVGPGTIGATVEILGEIAPTLYFNVPRGFDVLLPFLEESAPLRERFFSRLDILFYAAAALPQHLWRRLEAVAARAGGPGMTFLSAWGSTETAPMSTSVHFHIERAGVIGLPAPGTELKLVPAGEKLEMRVRGPNVTPGYWESGGSVTPITLDEGGFLSTGDAGRLEDPLAPDRGVVFDGRIAENFKLSSGTWVAVGELRLAVIAAGAPLVADAVVTGHDQRFLGLLIFPNVAACRALAGDHDGRLTPTELASHPTVLGRLRAKLDEYNYQNPSSSTRVQRALVLAEPPSIDGGEITDKGYINQGAVLTRRAKLVERLHRDEHEHEHEVISVIDLRG